MSKLSFLHQRLQFVLHLFHQRRHPAIFKNANHNTGTKANNESNHRMVF